MEHNALSEAPVGCGLRYGGLNVATGKRIGLDVFTVVTFAYLFVLVLFKCDGKDKLGHAEYKI